MGWKLCIFVVADIVHGYVSIKMSIKRHNNICQQHQSTTMLTIFTGTFTEAINIRNLLEINNIEVFTLNEFMSNIEPWAVSSGGFNPVILQVGSDDFEAAKKIIEAYTNGNLNLEKN